jgi:hypothetical protein
MRTGSSADQLCKNPANASNLSCETLNQPQHWRIPYLICTYLAMMHAEPLTSENFNVYIFILRTGLCGCSQIFMGEISKRAPEFEGHFPSKAKRKRELIFKDGGSTLPVA